MFDNCERNPHKNVNKHACSVHFRILTTPHYLEQFSHRAYLCYASDRSIIGGVGDVVEAGCKEREGPTIILTSRIGFEDHLIRAYKVYWIVRLSTDGNLGEQRDEGRERQ